MCSKSKEKYGDDLTSNHIINIKTFNKQYRECCSLTFMCTRWEYTKIREEGKYKENSIYYVESHCGEKTVIYSILMKIEVALTD